MAHQTVQDRPPQWHTWTRVALAGPGAVIIALLILAGMPLWLPAGAAGIDNLVVPLILAPLIWALLFFHACLDSKLARVALVAGLLALVHGGLVAARLDRGASATEAAR